MSVCSDAQGNLAWQWDEYDTDGSWLSSPLVALDIFVRSYTYNSGAGQVTNNNPNDETVIMANLKFGQNHNPAAAATYDNCRNTCTFFKFLIAVASATKGSETSDLTIATGNIRWLAGANNHALQSAYYAWEPSKALPEGDAKDYFEIVAITYLLEGHMRDRGAMANYRACFREERSSLFAIVETYFAGGIQEFQEITPQSGHAT